MCHLVLFRHVVKTGGTTLRSLFLSLAVEPDSIHRGGAGWRVAVPYADGCTSYHGWRRALLAQWMADRRASRSGGPNFFVEYHVANDAAHAFFEDLDAARSLQSAHCKVIAVGLVREPRLWVRSMFKHDLRLYVRKLASAPVHGMCAAAERFHSMWRAMAAWKGAVRADVRPYSDYEARNALNATLRALHLPLASDDETTNHTNSQSNALYWRVQQKPGPTLTRPPRFELYALQHGVNATYDVLGATEAMDNLVDEIFKRTGHSARPSLTPHNQIDAAAQLHLANASSSVSRADDAEAAEVGTAAVAEAETASVMRCAALAKALSGAPDAVFDAFANRSRVDYALWEAATRRAARAGREAMLPLEPTSPTAAYQWVMHKPPAQPAAQLNPKQAAASAAWREASAGLGARSWWDAFRLVPAGALHSADDRTSSSSTVGHVHEQGPPPQASASGGGSASASVCTREPARAHS